MTDEIEWAGVRIEADTIDPSDVVLYADGKFIGNVGARMKVSGTVFDIDARFAKEIERRWNAFDDLVKALTDMVKPLEWTKGIVDVAKTEDGVKYIICSRSGSNRDKWAFWSDNDPYSRQVCDSEEGARKAAHDYRVKQILKALGVSDE